MMLLTLFRRSALVGDPVRLAETIVSLDDLLPVSKARKNLLGILIVR